MQSPCCLFVRESPLPPPPKMLEPMFMNANDGARAHFNGTLINLIIGRCVCVCVCGYMYIRLALLGNN
jgi:hypothetical protein